MDNSLIKRQDAIDTLAISKEFLLRVLDDTDVVGQDREKYSWGLGLIESCINDIEELTSAQPEIKPISYQDCSNAMLMMWMDNVITDGEYNKIMDKLNAKHMAERRTDEKAKKN